MDRLKKRAEFVEVAKGARLHRSAFSLQAKPQRAPCSDARVGFTVTKKTGNAVERNRIRRRLKAAVANLPTSTSLDAGHDAGNSSDAGAAVSSHIDYVLIGRRQALSISYDALCKDLQKAFRTIDPNKRTEDRRTKDRRSKDRSSSDLGASELGTSDTGTSDRGPNPAAYRQQTTRGDKRGR